MTFLAYGHFGFYFILFYFQEFVLLYFVLVFSCFNRFLNTCNTPEFLVVNAIATTDDDDEPEAAEDCNLRLGRRNCTFDSRKQKKWKWKQLLFRELHKNPKYLVSPRNIVSFNQNN